MPKFKRKATTVDAFQWSGGWDPKKDPSWIATAMEKGGAELGAARIMAGPVMKIVGKTRILSAYAGDYIIRNLDGDIFPCSPEVFNLLYEEA